MAIDSSRLARPTRLGIAWQGFRYCATTLPRGLAAMVALPPLMFTGVLCLLGPGLLVMPTALRLLRQVTDSERARVGQWGEPVDPAGGHRGTTVARMVAEPATIRDLRWVPVMMITGPTLGLIGVALFLMPLAVLAGIGLWWLFPDDQPIRVLASIPIDSWGSAATLGVAQLVLAIAIALYVPPAAARASATVSRRLLGPSATEALAERVSVLDSSRAGAISAHGSELRRIERDLHDGTQARLVSIAMQLGLAERKLADDPQAVAALLTAAREGAEDAMVELRGVLRSVYPPVLADRGLPGALSGVAARCPVPTTLEVGELGEVPAQVEAALYFVVTEALTNIAKHSGATTASVLVGRTADTITVEVTDNGIGGATEGAGTGLRGMAQRIAAVDGVLRLTSPVGGPTVITVECPCGS